MATKANAAHILINSEKDALMILDRLKNGEGFAELAKRFSKCPSKSKGGNIGWFSKGQMVKEFEDAAFASKKGDTVGPVKTRFGWHIISVKDLK